MTKKSGTNIGDVQEMNRALVIDLLRQRKISSRAELAKATGLKKATITNIVADLIQWGLIRETGRLNGEKGRRAVGIELNTDRFKILGVRISQRFIDIALMDLLGNVSERRVEEILPTHKPEMIVQRIRNILWGYLRRRNGYAVLGIGLGAPGPVLKSKGRIAYNLTLFPGWERISVIKEFADEFDVPFYFDHDANTGALAEWKYGRYARQSGTMVYISAGDGIGCGVVIDGKIQHGSQGFFAEVGHTSIDYNGKKCGCGNRGCLDLYASGKQLMADVKESLSRYPDSILHQADTVNVGSIIQAMHQGDPLATEKISRLSWFLGFGAVNIVNAYDPDIIIIGDELSSVGPLLLNTVREVVKEHTLPEINQNIRIELTSLQVDPILLGAGALALDNILSSPNSYFSFEKKMEY